VQRSLLLKYANLVFNSIPHAIFTVDDDCRITAFNRTAEEITGYGRDEVLGRFCGEVLRGDGCERNCLLRDSMRVGQSHADSEVTICRKDGKAVPIAVSTAALHGEDGQVIGGVEMFRDLSDVTELRRQLKANYKCDDVISKSAAMRHVRDMLPLIARSDATVLIEGEPGTGKELVARAIHNLGARSRKPFVAVNCGAIPDSLVESELFGYVRGAFTDAKKDKPGRFALAQGGTLLLDEVGELSPAIQVKLLRVLQEREYTPLGAVRPVSADVRILAATNRDLAVEVVNRRFRQDLYFRLNIVRLTLPPLRSRPEDIPLLVERFIARFNAAQGRRITGISVTAMARLMSHSFPGNVRELENAIEHAFVVCGGSVIEVSDLPSQIASLPVAPALAAPPGSGPLERAEAETIREALARHGGHRGRAAAALGISRNTLWRKMQGYRLG
jgi:PAS domain S-box-containing protein